MPKLFVGNISFDATEAQLRTHFEQIANVSKATIVMDRETGKPRGFGFVEFETEKGAQEAMNHLNGVPMMGRALDIQPSKERQPQNRGARTQPYNREQSNGW